MKGPKRRKLTHMVDIHNIARKCHVCGGYGTVRNQDGHGAFGEATFCTEGCKECGGDGFIINAKNIKKALKVINNIQRKNNQDHIKFYGDV